MKKISVFLLSFTALFTFLICSDSLFAGDKEINVALLLWRGETKSEEGFKAKLKELGYSVQYTIFDAKQNQNNLLRIVRKEIVPNLKKYDYIYSFGTTASKSVRRFVENQTPHVFNIVNDPVKAEIVTSLEASGGNISGVSNNIPLPLQIETAFKVKKFKNIGLFFNPREENSVLIKDKLTAIGKKHGFKVVAMRVAPSAKGKVALEKYFRRIKFRKINVDAVYLSMDSFLLSNAQMIGKQLRAVNMISIGAHKKYIQNGALLGVIPDYYELGQLTAAIVDRHQKGEKLENIPVQTTKNPILMINKSAQDFFKIDIPEEFMKSATIIE